MYTFIDKELAKIKYRELLEAAREDRETRKSLEALSGQTTKRFRLALVTVLPMAILLVWAFVK